MVDTWHGLQADSVLRLLHFFQRIHGQRVPTIVDLGSGFGGTAYYVSRWMLGPALLVLVDIPLNLTTAYAYLSSVTSAETVLVHDEGGAREALGRPVTETRFVFLPATLVEVLRSRPIDVLLNAGSLAEMDLATVELYLATLVGETTRVFVEWNSHAEVEANRGHVELSARTFPVPYLHPLVYRKPLWRSDETERFLESAYVLSRRTAPSGTRRLDG